MGKKSKSKGNNKKKQAVSSSGSESGAPPANLSPANNSTESNDATSAADLLERLQSLTETLGRSTPGDFFGSLPVDNTHPADRGNTLRHRKREKQICIGRVVVLEGLQSETGKKLNGKYAMVISKEEDSDGRWECKVLGRDRTVGIKMTSIPQPEETPHPQYMEMCMYKMGLVHCKRHTTKHIWEISYWQRYMLH